MAVSIQEIQTKMKEQAPEKLEKLQKLVEEIEKYVDAQLNVTNLFTEKIKICLYMDGVSHICFEAALKEVASLYSKKGWTVEYSSFRSENQQPYLAFSGHFKNFKFDSQDNQNPQNDSTFVNKI
jgi:hypothetical protein